MTIYSRQKSRAVDARLLRGIVKTLLDELLQIQRADLGIFLVAAPAMTRLNEAFLHHAGSTDVITFDYHSVGADVRRLSKKKLRNGPRMEPPYVACYEQLHGEIFICVDEAAIQARRFRTNWQSELVRYVVHGLLHLRGFDDQRPSARRRMKREENRLLRELGRRFTVAKLAGPRRPSRTTRKSEIGNRKSHRFALSKPLPASRLRV